MKRVESYSAYTVSIRRKEKKNYCADVSIPTTAKRHSRAKRGSVVDFNK